MDLSLIYLRKRSDEHLVKGLIKAACEVWSPAHIRHSASGREENNNTQIETGEAWVPNLKENFRQEAALKNSLRIGLSHEFKFKIPKDKTVPHLYPESPEFQQMPNVLATGFLVGVCEWACIQAINPHIDWPREQTLDIDVQLNHTTPTPPRIIVTVKVRLDKIEGRKLVFSIIAEDEVEKISEGANVRFIIDAAKFNDKLAIKIQSHLSAT